MEDVKQDETRTERAVGIKKQLLQLWQKDRAIIAVVGVFLIMLLLSNYYGYRICNCASTEKWVPGTPHGGNHGTSHFYHK